jgi:DcrB
MQEPSRSPTPREDSPSTPPREDTPPRAEGPPGGDGPPPIPASRPGGGARWGEPGYEGAPDPDRRSRLAVAWIAGILGALGLAVAALVGFAILYSTGQRQPAPVVGAPFPTAPQPTIAPSAPGQDPTSPTTGADSGPPPSGDVAPSRTTNEFYSIRIPDGFQDVTDSYRTQHPTDRDTVQALAGQPGSPVTPDSSIVIARLPNGSARGRSLDELAADQVRALQRGGASGAGAPRHSSIGPDPAVEVDLTLRSGGQPLHRTQVLCVHDGRVWEIAVTSPTGARSLVTQAWNTVKTGWQWQ